MARQLSLGLVTSLLATALALAVVASALFERALRQYALEILEDDARSVLAAITPGPQGLQLDRTRLAPVFAKEKQLRGVGVVTGLAWTSMGGATLPVEATRVHSLNRGFKLTGKLGEVMKESCLLYTSPSPRDGLLSRMPSSA